MQDEKQPMTKAEEFIRNKCFPSGIADEIWNEWKTAHSGQRWVGFAIKCAEEFAAAERQSMLNSVEGLPDRYSLLGKKLPEDPVVGFKQDADGDWMKSADVISRLTYQHERNKAIPKCLEECRLSGDEQTAIWRSNHNFDIASKTESAVLEKVSRLLQSVEMPSGGELQLEISGMIVDNTDPESPTRTAHNAAVDIAAYIEERLSLALLAQQEKHRKEMQQFAKWLQINKFKIFGQDIIAAMTNINFSDLLTQFYNETKNKPS